MPFTSGTVSQFSGINGLLQVVLNFICGTEVTAESLGLPDGVLTNFSGTLSNSPVGLGRLVVKYRIGGTNYQAVDDGAGNIAGTGITSGAIVYASGAFNITFTNAPDNGSPLTADYIYGQPGRDWRVELNRNTRSKPVPSYTEPFGSDCKEVILSNTGLSGKETILIGMREWRYPAGNAYGWDLNGYLTYQAPADWNFNSSDHGLATYDNTWHHYTDHPMLPLIDNTMYYWLYANQQRVALSVKVQSNYESLYLGFGRRFGNPSDYPYPLCVLASLAGNYNYTDSSNYHRFIAGTAQGANYYRTWIVDPANRYLFGTQMPALAPYDDFYNLGTLRPADTGAFIMTPCYVCPVSVDDTLMDLDGVLHCMGVGIQAEDTLTFDSKTYRVFQNVFRNNYYEFMAVQEV